MDLSFGAEYDAFRKEVKPGSDDDPPAGASALSPELESDLQSEAVSVEWEQLKQGDPHSNDKISDTVRARYEYIDNAPDSNQR